MSIFDMFSAINNLIIFPNQKEEEDLK